MLSEVFIDWISASQYHPEGGLPIISGGLIVHFDQSGVPRFERNCSASVAGSYDTSVRLGSDGFRVSLSGNVGRFGREDNLFNFGWEGTKAACNRILLAAGLPSFTASTGVQVGEKYEGGYRGAVVSRLDITANYATGSESQARAFIRFLAGKSVSRMKKGRAGDESVWWANTHHMFKAYIKHIEMLAHGSDSDSPAFLYCKQEGVARVEIELKKRMLSRMGLNDWGDITHEKLVDVFHEQTSILRQVDRSSEPDLMDALPPRSRVYASAYLAGRDLRDLCNRSTLFRHAKVLREYGIDIMAPRENVQQFPVQLRVIDLQPLAVPEWYLRRAA